MNELCTKCYYLGKGKQPFYINFYLGLGLVIGSLPLFESSSFSDFNAIDWIFDTISFLLFFGGGLYIMHYALRGQRTCTNCGHKPMAALDEIQAIEIIRDKSKEIHTGSK